MNQFWYFAGNIAIKPLNLKQSLLLHHYYYQLIAVGNKKGEVKIYVPFNF